MNYPPIPEHFRINQKGPSHWQISTQLDAFACGYSRETTHVYEVRLDRLQSNIRLRNQLGMHIPILLQWGDGIHA